MRSRGYALKTVMNSIYLCLLVFAVLFFAGAAMSLVNTVPDLACTDIQAVYYLVSVCFVALVVCCELIFRIAKF